MTNRQQRHITAWIASLAILLASLMPAMSHALSLSKHAKQNTFSFITEICSVNGTRLHTVDASTASTALAEKTSGAHTDGTGSEHCPICLTQTGAVGLPPAERIIFPIQPGATVRPALFFHSPTPLFAWSAGQPRAPPLLS
ncbi:DUF2946 domain-containing protein [Noviherbaspirillum sp. Root189]|uniref:DUF2946 domain-containing protein n=1 Tax=Noviherbaspirillum sp. Root189 TaxID=1736487 RepID=UPI00070D4D63|nr:DUF2946 domain-containing protein [Noviherbaspirillum sp. Root189]KRB83876.1 hypothetical protein ASE07_23435 [Noviherbaspirillum sp. Root189]